MNRRRRKKNKEIIRKVNLCVSCYMWEIQRWQTEGSIPNISKSCVKCKSQKGCCFFNHSICEECTKEFPDICIVCQDSIHPKFTPQYSTKQKVLRMCIKEPWENEHTLRMKYNCNVY